MTATAPIDSPLASRSGLLGALAFGLVAMTLLLLQIVLSRLFASTLTYYYAFMLISLAMLGLAAGGLAVRLWPRLFERERAWERASWLSLGAAISIFAGTLAILALYPHISFDPANRFYLESPVALAGIFWCCFPAFLFGGIVVSGVLSSRSESFHTLYAIDLGFAAAGCVVALVLLEGATPTEVLLRVAAVLPVAAACLFALAAGRRRLAIVGLATAVALGLAGRWAVADPARAKPPHLAWRDQVEVLSEWNASSAVRAYRWPFFTWALSPNYRGPALPVLNLIIDGLGGTPVVRFDGRADSLARYEYLAYDLTHLPHVLQRAEGRQLVIGPGGGVDLLQAVRAGRRDITAVEINPLVVHVVNEDLREFSGSPYRLPGVRTAIENGRTFVKRARESWDLITLTWVDTGGSATALAFSENYLYTVEAFREYLDRLTPGGIVAFLRAWDMGVRVDSMRGVAVAVEALLAEGVADPGRHLLIAAAASPYYSRPMCLVLVGRSAFGAEQIDAARAFLSDRGFHAVWLPDGSVRTDDITSRFRPVATVLHEVIRSPDRATLYRQSEFDIQPATDDNPFYFVERAGPRRQAGIGVRQLTVYLGILLALVVPFLVLPSLPFVRSTAPLGPTGAAALAYFALLGLSFMLVEIEFFHLFALVLGNPTTTLAVVLSSLLVASGLGSLFGARLARSGPTALVLMFSALALLLALLVWLGPRLLDLLVVRGQGARIGGAVLVIAPIGFCMGLPMPLGMHLIRGRRDLVLWGWALNGATSVFASVAAIYLAIHVGISSTFTIGLVGYLLAGGLALGLRLRPPPAITGA